MLNQAGGDRQILAKQLGISPHQLSYVTQANAGEGLIFYGNTIIPFVDRYPKDTETYRIMTTRPPEKGGGAGLVIFASIGALAAGGAIYYLKIVRPKKRASSGYEDEDTPDEGSDREMEFEDEPGESGGEDTAEDGGE